MESIFQRFCAKDPLLYADVAYQRNEPDAEILYASEAGAFVRLSECEMLAATDPAEAARLLPYVSGKREIVLHEPFLLEALAARGFVPDMVCVQAVYTRRTPVAAALPAGVEIRLMTADELPIVLTHYHMPLGESYLSERMRAGMLGLYERGACAGFIGTHAEHSMGMLEILPAYRRRGYGYMLEGAMIDRLLAAGVTPYCQVVEDNAASLGLQRKLGLSFATGRVCWLTPPMEA